MRFLVTVLSLLVASTPVRAETANLLTFKDILAQAEGLHGTRTGYGPEPLQFGELWLPHTSGGHPLIVMIHGGCWRADLPGLELQAPLSRALANHGWAVWNIEYRRIGHSGGTYPGTFHDVAAGIDAVRGLAKTHPLDLSRVVFMGHSAGGHLAVWAGARGRLSKDSPLWSADPLVPLAVVTLAGINDLEAYHDHGPDACGGPTTIENLVDLERRGPSAYADTSPPHLLPSGRRQVVVSGELDPIVPRSFGDAYGAKAIAAGDRVQVVTLRGAGHFELIDPRSTAWTTLFPLIDALGGLKSTP